MHKRLSEGGGGGEGEEFMKGSKMANLSLGLRERGVPDMSDNLL